MTEESIPEELLKEAVSLCLANAEQYHKDAEILIDNRSYGHAFALAVLGEEELMKAYVYWACSEGLLPKDFIKSVGRVRESHLRKQAMAFGVALSYILVELAQSIRDSIEEQGEEDLEKRRKRAMQKFREAADNIREQGRLKRGETYELLEQFGTLQEDKEKGLYVDVNIEKGVLSSPKSLKKDEVEKYLSKAKGRFEFSKPLVMLSLPPSERNCVKALIREALKDYPI